MKKLAAASVAGTAIEFCQFLNYGDAQAPVFDKVSILTQRILARDEHPPKNHRVLR